MENYLKFMLNIGQSKCWYSLLENSKSKLWSS